MRYEAKKISSIIFDLDGTLVNTVPDVLLALNHTLRTFGTHEIAATEIYELIGNGARFMLENAFAKCKTVFSRDEIEAALACYLEYYMAHPVVATEIYPDVIEVLHQFKNSGIHMGICTNKPGVITRVLLDELNLTHFFSAVLCGDEVRYPKPNSQHVFDVLTKMQQHFSETVLVGDSIIDKLCADNAEIPFIGVSYGYSLPESVDTMIINHFNELPRALLQIITEEEVV